MEHSFDATVFTKNWQRLRAHDSGRAQFDEVVWAADEEGLLSDEYFSVDRNLIEAAASPGASGPRMDHPHLWTTIRTTRRWTSRGERRCNETHASTTDPEAGPRGAPAAQGAGQEGPAGVYGPRPDGEPPRSADGLHLQPSHRVRPSGMRFRNSWTGSGNGATDRARWGPTAATTPRIVWGTCGHDG